MYHVASIAWVVIESSHSGDAEKKWSVVSVELKWSIRGLPMTHRSRHNEQVVCCPLLRQTQEVARKHRSMGATDLSSVLRANFVCIILSSQSEGIYIYI